jgi:hypothetical protein
MNRNLYETGIKKNRRECFCCKYNDGSGGDIRVHTHVGTGRGRFQRAFFFDLFSSCSVHPPLPPSLLLLQQLQLLLNTSSYSYKSMMRRDVGNRKKDATSLLFLCFTSVCKRSLSLSLFVHRKDVIRTCTR